MLVETFQLMRKNLALFAACLVGLCMTPVLADLLGTSAGGHGGQLFITFFILRSVQQMVLAGGEVRAMDIRGSLGFMWRHAVLLVATTAIAIIPLIALGNAPGAFLLVLAMAAAVYPLLLALVGTWPMTNIVPDGITLLGAVRCGGRRFARTYGRLLLATALPLLVALVCSVAISAPDLLVDGKFNPRGAVTDLLAEGAQLFSLTYIAVVLTRKYLGCVPSDDHPTDGVALAANRGWA